MEKPCVQGVVAGHPLDQRGVEGDLLFRLRDVHKAHAGETGNLLGRSGRIRIAKLRAQHFRV